MPEFLAHVFQPAHGVEQRRVIAADADGVAAALGIAPSALVSVHRVAESSRRGGSSGPIDLRLFSQELALLLQSGIPLLEGLQTLREKGQAGSGPAALDLVIDALREGQPMSSALARAPRSFDALFIAIVAASERTGQLVQALQDHAAFLAWRQELRGKLWAACIYPLLLLGVGSAVVVFLLVFVLPRFAAVFDGLGDAVPAGSRLLIQVGTWLAAHPGVGTVTLGALALALLLAGRWPAARQTLARQLWRLPGLGARWRIVELARLYRGLSMLLAAGVPVPAALRLLQPVMALPLQPALGAALDAVESGTRLSAAMHVEGLATPVALRMLRVGEGSGELGLMLSRAAAFHDEEIARFSELVTRAVNPVLMLVMGVLIGGIVILMYLPIFTLMERVQ